VSDTGVLDFVQEASLYSRSIRALENKRKQMRTGLCVELARGGYTQNFFLIPDEGILTSKENEVKSDIACGVLPLPHPSRNLNQYSLPRNLNACG
jgi:hypothetical protein